MTITITLIPNFVFTTAAVTLLATADLTTSFDATLTQTLTNGTYFIEVRSDGENGEHGQYTVNINTQAEVNSIALVGAAATNASSVHWTVNFLALWAVCRQATFR